MPITIIPAINVNTFDEIEARLDMLARAFDGQDIRPTWVQIDVADGTFTDSVRWHSPMELARIETHFNVELHLMLNQIDTVIHDWLRPHLGRIIFHIEASDQPSVTIAAIREKGIAVGIALKPGSRWEECEPYLSEIETVQFLAVTPGTTGSRMDGEVIRAISDFHRAHPSVAVEIDGGINVDTVADAVRAGATLIVSGAAIFGESDIARAYRELYVAAAKAT